MTSPLQDLYMFCSLEIHCRLIIICCRFITTFAGSYCNTFLQCMQYKVDINHVITLSLAHNGLLIK